VDGEDIRRAAHHTVRAAPGKDADLGRRQAAACLTWRYGGGRWQHAARASICLLPLTAYIFFARKRLTYVRRCVVRLQLPRVDAADIFTGVLRAAVLLDSVPGCWRWAAAWALPSPSLNCAFRHARGRRFAM